MQMHKLAIAIAAAAAFGLAVPTIGPAQAEDTKVVIKKKQPTASKVVIRQGDRGYHRGFTHSRHWGYDRNRSSKTVVVKKQRDMEPRAQATKKVIIKRDSD
jgi:hypothetical protein